MKLGRWLSTAALSMFLGTFLLGALVLSTTALVQAQEQRDESKPAQPEATKPSPQDEHASRPEDAKPSKQQEDVKQQDEDKKNADKAARNDDKAAKQEEKQEQKEGNARNEQNQPSTERAEAKGDSRGRIPDDKFRSNFGRQPTVVQGRPTFQYGGYSFALVDAWPGGWAYTDQCYIDYIDGEYFLFDLAHPGVRLAIVVAL